MYGISEIATTKLLVVASSVQVAPERLLLVGVHPHPPKKISPACWLFVPNYVVAMVGAVLAFLGEGSVRKLGKDIGLVAFAI